MKTILKTEEAVKLVLAFYLCIHLGFVWWSFLAWILAPDISMLAYLAGKKAGAYVYNLFHHQGIAILVAMCGFYYQNPELEFAGLILFGHSSMDRVMGYGLKYADDFKNTHLGWIGKRE
ncbi:MAG TPA: DUF4260 domain-containing protein [Bacteroidia bacterium]|nr:DUF4260 domain-containing protein [Bacteroidia bacterium]